MSMHDSAVAIPKVDICPGLTLEDYLKHCREVFPQVAERLDEKRFTQDAIVDYYRELGKFPAHFEGDDEGGRGDSYRESQLRFPNSRLTGIQQLFDLFLADVRNETPFIVDLLGGNGTLTRAANAIYGERSPFILTSDVSAAMFRNAMTLGHPAVRQGAQQLLLKDCSVDGALYSYGTHHIPPSARPDMVAEAFRVLAPGGRIVLQDFEEGTPTARWYSELLDKHTTTGHPCKHFTKDGMQRLLIDAGFKEVRVIHVYDPFIITTGPGENARNILLDYVLNLFGLQSLRPASNAANCWERVVETLAPYTTFTQAELPAGRPTVTQLTWEQTSNGGRAELPRVALVATGQRPL